MQCFDVVCVNCSFGAVLMIDDEIFFEKSLLKVCTIKQSVVTLHSQTGND